MTKIKTGELYQNIRDNLQNFDIIFFKGDKLPKKTKSILQKRGNKIPESKDFIHIGICLKYDLLQYIFPSNSIIQEGDIYLWDSSNKNFICTDVPDINSSEFLGSQLRNLDKIVECYDKSDTTQLAVGKLEINPFSLSTTENSNEFIEKFKQTFYKYYGEFNNIPEYCKINKKMVQRILKSDKCMFSSEMIVNVFKDLEIYNDDVNPKNITPSEILIPDDKDNNQIIINHLTYITTSIHYKENVSNIEYKVNYNTILNKSIPNIDELTQIKMDVINTLTKIIKPNTENNTLSETISNNIKENVNKVNNIMFSSSISKNIKEKVNNIINNDENIEKIYPILENTDDISDDNFDDNFNNNSEKDVIIDNNVTTSKIKDIFPDAVKEKLTTKIKNDIQSNLKKHMKSQLSPLKKELSKKHNKKIIKEMMNSVVSNSISRLIEKINLDDFVNSLILNIVDNDYNKPNKDVIPKNNTSNNIKEINKSVDTVNKSQFSYHNLLNKLILDVLPEIKKINHNEDYVMEEVNTVNTVNTVMNKKIQLKTNLQASIKLESNINKTPKKILFKTGNNTSIAFLKSKVNRINKTPYNVNQVKSTNNTNQIKTTNNVKQIKTIMSDKKNVSKSLNFNKKLSRR